MIDVIFSLFEWILKGIMNVAQFIYRPFGATFRFMAQSKKNYKKDKKFLDRFNKQRQRSFKNNDEMF